MIYTVLDDEKRGTRRKEGRGGRREGRKEGRGDSLEGIGSSWEGFRSSWEAMEPAGRASELTGSLLPPKRRLFKGEGGEGEREGGERMRGTAKEKKMSE